MHVLFWVYVVALMSGAASSSIAFFVHTQHRKSVELGFGFFLLSLLGIVASMAVQQYESAVLPSANGAVSAMGLALMLLGAGGYMFAWPSFYHPLVGTTPAKWLRAVYLVVAIVFVLLGLSVFFVPTFTPILIALNVMLFGMIAYGIVAIALRYKRIGDRRLRAAVRVFLIISIVFFPLMYADSMIGYLPANETLAAFDGTALPVFFIVLNVLAIRFAGVYLNEPPYLADGQVSRYFREVFGVSEREGEIIGLLIDGKTTREVAEQLYISAKTVENHVYNIYQKTRVRNRVELVNLILEHKAG